MGRRIKDLFIIQQAAGHCHLIESGFSQREVSFETGEEARFAKTLQDHSGFVASRFDRAIHALPTTSRLSALHFRKADGNIKVP